MGEVAKVFKAEPTVLRRLRKQLQQATQEHSSWHDSVIRKIVCRLSFDPAELESDAHRHCRFGHWCHEQAPNELREQPTFAEIVEEHRLQHRIAARLLEQAASQLPIDVKDYDAWAEGNVRLHLALDTLRHEIQGALRSTDALTGAYGRVEMLPELREWHELSRRNVQRCCVAFMDMDNLKIVNDSHGHALGDQVLAAVVHYLTEDLRPYDKVFRYGGDEFLISLPGVDLALAQKIMQRIREGLGGTRLADGPNGEPIYMTASFGIATLDPDVPVEESIDRADKALLLAKAAGRNRVMTWDPAVTTGTMLQRYLPEDVAE
jgi:diguanylate cyclase